MLAVLGYAAARAEPAPGIAMALAFAVPGHFLLTGATRLRAHWHDYLQLIGLRPET
jgi:hypothetical protein